MFETPHNETKCVMSIKESNFNEKFSHLLTVRAEGADPPTLTVSLAVKYSCFLTTPLRVPVKNVLAEFVR